MLKTIEGFEFCGSPLEWHVSAAGENRPVCGMGFPNNGLKVSEASVKEVCSACFIRANGRGLLLMV